MHFIQQLIQRIFSDIGYGIFAAVTLAIAAVGAFFLGRWSWRWLVAILLILLLCAFLWMAVRVPAQSFLRTDLPGLFFDHFWAWIFLLAVGSLWSFFTVAGLLRGPSLSSAATVAEPDAEPSAGADLAPAPAPAGFPDLDAAWDSLRIRMSQARIDLGRQPVTLLIAPHEDWSAALIQAANLQLFAQAPETAAPIHAYASAEGVLLSCSGASALGGKEAGGSARLEHLCRRLLALQPDCPVVRAVAVVFPMSWALRPDAARWAAAVRDDLRAIQRVLKVRCPAFALFGEMEAVPGFPEFIGRMERAMRESRVGFATPRSQEFSGDLVTRGLTWLSGWFHTWILNRMAGDLFNHPGNDRLFSLDYAVRRDRIRLRKVVEEAFSTHRDSEPTQFRGCYFMATGRDPAQQAFVAGLFRGTRARIIAEHPATLWTQDAVADDRRYRRLALAVGLTGGTLLLIW
ncbi:MAG TPA: type VI secretion protein IcmF/TssM N-terminal domain-containing protein, partial [Isosphaeraceae bacterium]